MNNNEKFSFKSITNYINKLNLKESGTGFINPKSKEEKERVITIMYEKDFRVKEKFQVNSFLYILGNTDELMWSEKTGALKVKIKSRKTTDGEFREGILYLWLSIYFGINKENYGIYYSENDNLDSAINIEGYDPIR